MDELKRLRVLLNGIKRDNTEPDKVWLEASDALGTLDMYEHSRAQPENKPFSLEKLEQMNGEPVYVKFKSLTPVWGICVHGWIRTGSGFRFKADVYEAKYYAHKPEVDAE